VQTTPAAVALVAAAVALVYANLQARAVRAAGADDSEGPPRALLMWYAALVVAGFLATLPTRPPFAPGLTFGWGFLIGGLAGVYAAFEVARSWRNGAWLARAIGLVGAATAGPALILLLFAGNPDHALMGCALGAVLLALIWRLCLGPLAAREPSGDEAASQTRGADLFALVAVATAVATRLGVEHFGGDAAGPHGALRALPPLIAGLSALALIVPSALAAPGRVGGARLRALPVGLVAAAITLVVVVVLAWKVLGVWAPALAALTGFAGFALIAWLACPLEQDQPRADSRPVLEVFGIALVALAMVAVSFKLLHGYGESLALMAGIAPVMVVAAAAGTDRRSMSAPLLAAGYALVLLLATYRLLLEHLPGAEPLQMQAHYDYFALVLGAAAVFGLLAWAEMARRVAARGDETEAVRTLIGRAPGPLIAVVLAPMLLLVLWGEGAVGGLLVGLVIAELAWMMVVAWSTGADRLVALSAAPHAALMAVALVAAQLSPRVAELAELSRAWKAGVVLIVAGVAVVWLVLSAVLGARRPTAAGGESDA